jgi:hypothetical protein
MIAVGEGKKRRSVLCIGGTPDYGAIVRGSNIKAKIALPDF